MSFTLPVAKVEANKCQPSAAGAAEAPPHPGCDAQVATGDTAIKGPSPLNVLKDTDAIIAATEHAQMNI